jgi:hypothetical protein
MRKKAASSIYRSLLFLPEADAQPAIAKAFLTIRAALKSMLQALSMFRCTEHFSDRFAAALSRQSRLVADV